jgi:hypothetical protein
VFFVVSVTIAVLLAARGVRWGVPLLIVLTAADLGAWGLTYVYRVAPDTIDSLTVGLPVVSNARIIASEGEWKDMPILKGYRLMGGYVGIYPAIPYTSVEFNRSAGAAWDLKGDGIVTKIPWHEAPRARLVVEDPLPPANTPGELGSAKVTMDRPGRLVVKTTAPAPRLLVLNERFDKGWSATVDGKDASPVSLRGFLSFRADSGMHEVEFRFLPRSFLLGCLATGVGAILLAVSTLVTLRERK